MIKKGLSTRATTIDMIRLALLADAAAIAFVHIASWRETYRGLLPQSELDQLDAQAREKMWADIIKAGGDVWIMQQEEAIAGFCSVGRFRENDASVNGELLALYVLQKFQKQGFGGALFDTGAKSLDSYGLMPFGAWVLADNPACGFYETKGGVIVGERVEKLGDEELTEILYRFDHAPNRN